MSAPFVVVDAALDIAPYQQIAEQIRALIERGELVRGAALPTVRQLAGDLGVAPNTVARAYADLQGDGWLVSDGRRGTRVAPHVPSENGRSRSDALKTSIEHFVDSLTHRGFTPGEIAAEVGNILRSSS